MVRKLINLELQESTKEPFEPISSSIPATDFVNMTFSINVNFGAGMPITEPSRRDLRDDIVVVDPSIISNIDVVHISFVPDSGAAKGLNFLRNGFDMGKFAAACTNGCHCAAE